MTRDAAIARTPPPRDAAEPDGPLSRRTRGTSPAAGTAAHAVSRSAVLLVVLVLVELAVLYPGVLFRGEILSAATLGYGAQPWRAHVPETGRPLVSNPVLSDDLSMFAPWDAYRRGPARASLVPLWNPASSCGSPFLAANQTAVLAPAQLPRLFWPSPRARTFGLLASVLVAALGMFCFLRALGIDPGCAALGGVVWSNAACMLVWLLYPLAETMAWFSWFAAGSVGLLLRETPPRTARPVTAAGLAAMLLAGHLPTAAQCLALTGLCIAVGLVANPAMRRRVARLALPFAVGALLAAPQVLPTLEYFAESRAKLVRGGELGQTSAEQGLPLSAAWSWLVPGGFGAPHLEGYRGPLNFNEATAHIGLLALLLGLLVIGLRRRGPPLALAALTAGCLLAAHGTPPIPSVLGATPVLAWAPGLRWVVLAQWAAAALAAVGGAILLTADRKRAVWCLGAAGAALLLLLGLHPAIAGIDAASIRPHEARAVARSAAELVIVVGACLLVGGRRGFWPAALLTIVAAAFGTLAGYGFNPTVAPEVLPGATPETRLVSRLAGRERMLPLGWVTPRDSHLLAGLSSARGWDAIGLERTTRFAERAGWRELDTATRMPEDALRLTRRAAVAVVAADHPIESSGLTPVGSLPGPGLWAFRVDGAHPLAGWYGAAESRPDLDAALAALASDGGLPAGVVVLEDEPDLPDRGAFESAPVPLDVERPRPERVEVQVNRPAPGWVVLREAAAPGWHASVDGVTTRIRIADGAFLAVPVDAGAHRVEFTYRPLSFAVGSILAVSGVVLFAGMAAWRRRPQLAGRARRPARAASV